MLAKRLLMGILFAVTASVAQPGAAQDRMYLSYQGRLTDGSGKPLTGVHPVRFRILDAPRNGRTMPIGDTPWEENFDLTFNDGVFSVYLGAKNIFQVGFFDGPPADAQGPVRYLEITVDGKTVPVAPRLQIPKQ